MLKADLHVHTPNTDGFTPLDKLVLRAKELGLSAIAVSDHNVCTPLPDCDLTLIPAVEISTTFAHIVGLYVRNIDVAALCAGGRPDPQTAIDAIRAAGGAAVLAHPFETGAVTEEMLDGVTPDFIETANSRAVLKFKNANARAAAYAEKRGIPQTGGSDAHCAEELGGSYTEIDCESPSELEAAIRAGRTRAVFVKPSRWRYKGRAEIAAVCRMKLGAKRTLRAPFYYAYNLLRDIFGR